MDANDLLGHLWYIILLVGQLFITRKRRIGFIFRVVGELGWVVIGVALGMSSIVIWSSIFAVVDIIGWIRWKEKSHEYRNLCEMDAEPR